MIYQLKHKKKPLIKPIEAKNNANNINTPDTNESSNKPAKNEKVQDSTVEVIPAPTPEATQPDHEKSELNDAAILSIYNKLNKSIELLNDDKTLIEGKKIINDLIYNLSLKIRVSTAPVRAKGRSNYCIKYAEKLKKGGKPILGYAFNDTKNNIQIFSDSYFLACLTEADKLPLTDSQECKSGIYPSFENIIKGMSKNNAFIINVNDTLNKLKIAPDKADNLHDFDDFEVWVTLDNFKRFITFMNIKENENITLYTDGQNKPIYYYKDNGSFGLFLPCRIRKNK